VLQPGESLLIYTDGVTDMLDAKGAGFGVEGLRRSVQGAGQATPQQLIDRIARGVQGHAGSTDPFDDVTLVGFGRPL